MLDEIKKEVDSISIREWRSQLHEAFRRKKEIDMEFIKELHSEGFSFLVISLALDRSEGSVRSLYEMATKDELFE